MNLNDDIISTNLAFVLNLPQQQFEWGDLGDDEEDEDEEEENDL